MISRNSVLRVLRRRQPEEQVGEPGAMSAGVGRRRQAPLGVRQDRRELWQMAKKFALNDVFTPGGQPSITYVSRPGLNIEGSLSKALAQRNIIVSLTGPTKSGKTVLCKNVLRDIAHVWLEGGQIKG